jgi:DNA processing protein
LGYDLIISRPTEDRVRHAASKPTTFFPDELLGPLNDVERRFAPPRLYVRGDRSVLDAPRVAVVGTRRPSQEGTARTRRLVRELVENGAVIVSGLAEGVDTAAHLAAIEAGGRTVAVLGTPLDEVYPASNRDLQERIARDHLVVSQFESGVPVQRKNFPQRNRTMALIADASVIVEAGDGSGTLSQGWEALRLGRPLYFLRSLQDVPGLAWPRKMAEYGASVLERIEPLLEVLPSPRLRDERQVAL